MSLFSVLIIFLCLKYTESFGFYSHDLISILTWNKLLPGTKRWLCDKYEVCNIEDFETINALPDLMKHHANYIKYFSLHFYNNNLDIPPKVCKLDVEEALEDGTPNLIQAVIVLLTTFQRSQLSFVELSYLIHLIADLHQPFHLTAYDRGGMNRKLCNFDGKTCWSLHALWDAEILKQTSVSERNIILLSTEYKEEGEVFEDVTNRTILEWAQEMNSFICLIYSMDDHLSLNIEDYSYYMKGLAIYLVDLAAKRIARILNQNQNQNGPLRRSKKMSFNTAVEFEREISSIKSDMNKMDSALSEQLLLRYKDLTRQFSVKSSFLSGYQLRQLREKVKDLDKLFASSSVVTSEISVNQGKAEEIKKLDVSSVVSPSTEDIRRIQVVNREREEINLKDVEGDVIIDNLTKCKVKLSGPISSLKIRNIHQSDIDVTYCNGPVYVENVTKSVLRIAGDQVRIHESIYSKIYLFTNSSCVLEDCLHLQFHPNLSLNKEIGDSNWKNIQDFGLNADSYKTYDAINNNDDNDDLFLCDE